MALSHFVLRAIHFYSRTKEPEVVGEKRLLVVPVYFPPEEEVNDKVRL